MYINTSYLTFKRLKHIIIKNLTRIKFNYKEVLLSLNIFIKV
jgi:hypothetical protein